MILPDRVLGSSATSRIWRGLAIGPISLATWLRSSVMNASASCARGRGHAPAHDDEGDDALAGHRDRSAPTTAASATDGCETSADSTSVVEMRWPDTFITSSTRPSSQRSPSSSFLAPSPAK